MTKKEAPMDSKGVLGWHFCPVQDPDIAKVVVSSDLFSIVELRNEKRVYVIAFPTLSKDEEQLVLEVLVSFQTQSDTSRFDAEDFRVFFDSFCEERFLDLESAQSEYLFRLLYCLAFLAGPLQFLLENKNLEEIAVCGVERSTPVRVFDRDFGWLETNLVIFSPELFRNLVNRIVRKTGRRLSLKTPRINAVLEDGSRIHAAMEPVSFSGPTLTIRKFRERPFSPLELIRFGTLSSEMAAFLWMAFLTDCSVLLCGNTGSGKTSSLNAFFCFVPEKERVISVEETPELKLSHPHWIRLTTSEEAGISMRSLILDSLRMRPDRIVVGEIRSKGEVKAFLDTLLAGQGKGSMATFHAQSGKEALVRMRSYGVLEMDLASIDLIVVQRRFSRVDPATLRQTEERRIVEISEVDWNGSGVELRKLFEFDFGLRQFKRVNQSIRLAAKMVHTFGVNPLGLEQLLAKRRLDLEERVIKETDWGVKEKWIRES
ncbi:MAG: CpaF family protein [Candidatus Diapherotrites archaeon]|uniref:CpaF family protein n=1 Tax=Candidatus Iainarchaeum sp. TaxID=3101447 RepID=A0A8T4L4F8_9ARCH|nr:CpaF family protein [Candidatus Diapherotrites archaeon]